MKDVKFCTKCKKKFSINYFISRDDRSFKITCMCNNCRYKNASKFIAREHNLKNKIFQTLKQEGIKRIHIYTLYLNQRKKCYLCQRRVNIPLLYINRFNHEKPYYGNTFLSCVYCYTLYDADQEMYEFMDMLEEAHYPFNKSNIRIRKPYYSDKRIRSINQQILGN